MSKPAAPPRERFMAMVLFERLVVGGHQMPVADPSIGLCGFIPAFDTRAQAEAFAEGRYEVRGITTAPAYDDASGRKVP